MLGLVVLAHHQDGHLAPSALLEDLLGVPLLARAIAGALPADEPVAGVLVTDEQLAGTVRADVLERFGFDEIDKVVAAGPGLAAGLKAGLDALGEDVEHVVVTSGAQVLSPLGLVDRVVAAARRNEAASPAMPVQGHIVADEGDGVVPLDIRARLRRLQAPQAFRVGSLRAALDIQLDEEPADAAGQVLGSGNAIVIVDGDPDNLLICDAADVGRAVEVFSRRAVDYAFVYPKDLLPEDPLSSALAPGEELGEGIGRARDEGERAGS